MDFQKAFGEKMRLARMEKGLSVEETSKKSGISAKRISEIEEAEGASPNLFEMISVCDVYETTVDMLVTAAKFSAEHD